MGRKWFKLGAVLTWVLLIGAALLVFFFGCTLFSSTCS